MLRASSASLRWLSAPAISAQAVCALSYASLFPLCSARASSSLILRLWYCVSSLVTGPLSSACSILVFWSRAASFAESNLAATPISGTAARWAKGDGWTGGACTGGAWAARVASSPPFSSVLPAMSQPTPDENDILASLRRSASRSSKVRGLPDLSRNSLAHLESSSCIHLYLL